MNRWRDNNAHLDEVLAFLCRDFPMHPFEGAPQNASQPQFLPLLQGGVLHKQLIAARLESRDDDSNGIENTSQFFGCDCQNVVGKRGAAQRGRIGIQSLEQRMLSPLLRVSPLTRDRTV